MKKLPIDNRVRPVYVLRNKKREVVVSDGKGNAFDCGNNPHTTPEDFIKPELLIKKKDYQFIRGLTGFDF